ncbi:hypothetical protein M422DRAFT_258947 [Sphaerobolus stellatus SS14]|uniref:Uncharacterized protein n=1 Tax=Sphaerobolus stellatus (strain SS14) TaxID=990650 RepID=A0A0C9UTX3_SPHS4|nr:hypothetical protein M422DRAFT_258947 [Sphaerobolus stellatus SS14]
MRTIQNRGKTALTIIDHYNKIVDEVYCMNHPTWMADSAMPQQLEQWASLVVDPDSALWDDVSMSHIWSTLWGTDVETAPAYARDSNVQKGIRMVLVLDRIREEHLRLAIECENEISFDSPYRYRLQQVFKDLLASCRYYFHGRNLPDQAVWRLPTHRIQAHIDERRELIDLFILMRTYFTSPSNRGNTGTDFPISDNDDNIFLVLDSTHYLQSMDADIANEFGGEDDDICDDQSDASIHSENEDDQMDGEIVSTLSDTMARLVVEERIELTLSTETKQDPRSIWRANNDVPKSLPSISSLLELIDGRPTANNNNNSVDTAYRVWSIAADAL